MNVAFMKRREKETNIPTYKRWGKILKENSGYLLLCAPALILIILFCYLPMFGIVIAFKDVDYSNNIFAMDWVGLKNFKFLFSNPDVFIALKNTILYNAVFVILGLLVPVTLAILLNLLLNKKMAKIYQSIMFLPYFMSWVVVACLGFAFFDYNLGFLNKSILTPLGLEGVQWYLSPQYWPVILVIFHVWKTAGYSTVVYLASIAGIDQELYEAAAIDGAGIWKQTMHITIPGLKSVMIILTILAVGKILNSDFGMFYNLPMRSGALQPVTMTIDTFTYNLLKNNGDMAVSSAAGLFQSVVGFVLVVVTNAVVKKIDDSQALF